MGVTTRPVTTEEEIYTCDICSAEQDSYDLKRCFICRKYICWTCSDKLHWGLDFYNGVICKSDDTKHRSALLLSNSITILKKQYDDSVSEIREQIRKLRDT